MNEAMTMDALEAMLRRMGPRARRFAMDLREGVTTDQLEQLQERLLETNEKRNNIKTAADAAKRDFTAEEEAEMSRLKEVYDKTKRQIEVRQTLLEDTLCLTEGGGRRSQPDDPAGKGGQSIQIHSSSYDKKGKWGWNTVGDFALAVASAAKNPGAAMDPRLVANAPTTSSTEGVGSDGGHVVPPDFREEIFSTIFAEDEIASLCDVSETSRNRVVIPLDEDSPWSTSGIQVYWEAEGATPTQSKVAINAAEPKLDKMMALVPVSDELLEDAPQMDRYLRRKAPEKMGFKLNQAILSGTGAGQPLGILNADCLVTQAAESGQTADTVNDLNIHNMWGRLYGRSRRNAVWLINQDVEAQLRLLAFQNTAAAGPAMVSGGPVYIGPGTALNPSSYGTLNGRPVIPTEACSKLGDVGDIILVDLMQYALVRKTGGVRAQTSMHLFFDTGHTAYRFDFRVTGMPYWSQTLARADSTNTNTLSPFVALEAR